MRFASWSVLVLLASVLLCGLVGSSELARGDDRGGVTTPFYTSFPTTGGPYIAAATWDPNAEGGNGELRVIFNEALDWTSISGADFEAIGFEWGEFGPDVGLLNIPSSEDRRVVGIRDFAAGNPPTIGDSIALATLQVSGDLYSIVGSDGYSSGDRTHVPITTGPAMVAVSLSNWAENNGNADNDEILVVFEAPIAPPTGGWDDELFALTPELQPINPSAPTVEFDFALGSGSEANQLTLTRCATSGPDDPHFRQIWPGIAKFWLDAGAAVWDGTALSNDRQVMMTDNASAGPILLGAHWNDVSEELWLVFSEPIDPTSLDSNPMDQYFLFGGAYWGVAQSQALLSPTDYSNVVRVAVFDGLLGLPGAGIQVAAGHELRDHQGEIGPLTNPVDIVTGIGILRSSYDEGGTPTNPYDDVLDVWFSEPFADLMAVDGSDFTLDNPDLDDLLWDEVTVSASNVSGFGYARVTGWGDIYHVWLERLPVGSQVRLRLGTDIRGSQTLSSANTSLRARVVEDLTTWPMSTLQQVVSLPRQYHDWQTGVDRAYLAWREMGSNDPADSYLLFYTNEGPGMFTQAMIDNYKSNATPASNRRGELIDGGINRFSVDITPGTQTTTGNIIMEYDAIWFMLVPVTYHGSLAPIASALVFTEDLVVGGICPPFDFRDDDDDLIHVAGTQVGPPHGRILTVVADCCSAPCGDNLYVFDGPDPFSANVLGSGPIMPDCSFGPLMLTPEANALPTLFLSAEYLGDFSQTTPIINDLVPPTIALDVEDLVHPDRFNPYRMYTKDDYINILVHAFDGAAGNPEALSDLLTVWADFSEIDERLIIPPELGGFYVDSIPFVSLGNDQRDNDGDWDDSSPNTGNGNGNMDFPEPYCDENGDGYFTPGETFIDRNSNMLCDAPHGPGGAGDPWYIEYDWYLDCTDPDEHGWYEIQLLTDVPYWDEHAHSSVTKGFCVVDPITDPTGLQGPPEAENLPVGMGVHDGLLDLATQYTAPDSILFRCELDERAPSLAQITELYSLSGYTEPSDPGQNLMIAPGDSSTYVLGPERYMNFMIQTPSDNDVLFLVIEIFQNRVGAWAWEPLVLDPPGVNGDPAAPGLGGFDDDRDVIGQGLLTNGIDDDEDGTIDEADEGLDFSDPEVVDAVQDSIADAQAAGGDGIHRLNDHCDNDNDAFYVFEPYFDEGAATSEDVSQRTIWFNIDESDMNNLDDDFDGLVDEMDEIEFYSALYDDNEDGIMDAEAAEITIDGLRSVYNYPSNWFSDQITGNFYIGARQIVGQSATDFDGDIRALTEFIAPAYDVIDPSGILVQPFPGLGWGDSTAHTSFEWFASHGSTNIDLMHIAGLYNMMVDGSVRYRLRGVAYDQVGNADPEESLPLIFTIRTDVSAVEDPPPVIAPIYPLQTRCPSPFLPGSRVHYSIPSRGEVTLSVMNVQGRRVATLFKGVLPAGIHEAAWDGRGQSGSRQAAGIYFMRLEAQNERTLQKIILIR